MSEEAATEALVALSRTMTAVVARTLGEVRGVSIPQLRALVLVATRGPMNLKVLAESVGVNASNASRTCEKLVSAGLLERSLPQRDRRNVALGLTDEGAALVRSLMESRRELLGAVVAQMSSEEQDLLVRALDALNAAVATVPELEVNRAPDGRLIPWLI
jgi:DNA-binding MarR family transcriptional regulator